MDENRALFEQFLEVVAAAVDDCEVFVAMLQRRYARTNPHFLRSNMFEEMITKWQLQMQSNDRDKYAHLLAINETFKIYETKPLKHLLTGQQLEDMEETRSVEDQLGEDWLQKLARKAKQPSTRRPNGTNVLAAHGTRSEKPTQRSSSSVLVSHTSPATKKLRSNPKQRPNSEAADTSSACSGVATSSSVATGILLTRQHDSRKKHKPTARKSTGGKASKSTAAAAARNNDDDDDVICLDEVDELNGAHSKTTGAASGPSCSLTPPPSCSNQFIDSDSDCLLVDSPRSHTTNRLAPCSNRSTYRLSSTNAEQLPTSNFPPKHSNSNQPTNQAAACHNPLANQLSAAPGQHLVLADQAALSSTQCSPCLTPPQHDSRGIGSVTNAVAVTSTGVVAGKSNSAVAGTSTGGVLDKFGVKFSMNISSSDSDDNDVQIIDDDSCTASPRHNLLIPESFKKRTRRLLGSRKTMATSGNNNNNGLLGKGINSDTDVVINLEPD